MQVGKFVKELRKLKNWTLKDLSQKSGLSEMSISNIENNINQPSPISLKKLADAFEYDYDVLYYMAFAKTSKEK